MHRSLTRAHDSIFVVCRTRKDAPKRLPAEEAARHRKRSWGQTIAPRSARLPKSGVRRLGSKTNGKPAGRAFASHEEDVVDSRSGTRACPRPADPGRPLEGPTVRGGLRTGSRVGARDTKPRNGKACQRCPGRRRLSSNEEQTARPLRGRTDFPLMPWRWSGLQSCRSEKRWHLPPCGRANVPPGGRKRRRT